MRAKVRLYPGDSPYPLHFTVEVDTHDPFWEYRLRKKFEDQYGERTFPIIVAIHDPRKYPCLECGSPVSVPCTKNGTVLKYFHEARLIEAGLKKPPVKKWKRNIVWGRKRRGHRSPEKLHKSMRRIAHHKDRQKAKREIRETN